jgi:hypothetical protein
VRFSDSRNQRATLRVLVTFCLFSFFAASDLSAQGTGTEPTLPPYRYRLLGVYDAQSGDPIEGAEVVDMLSKTSALTTKTGTISLFFLPDGGGIVRIRKLGYQPITMPLAISPADTVPVTVTMTPAATTLPTVVTTDSAPHYLSPRLREFEDRRKQGFGYFITEAEMRKNDNGTMTNMVRRFPGVNVVCRGRGCRAVSMRGGCGNVVLYIDGVRSTDSDLEKINVNEYAGAEYYAGGATAPPQYNATGSSCGVLLLWSRER